MHVRTLLSAAAAGLRSVPWPKHLFLCVADHFEPEWHGAGQQLQTERVHRWTSQYAKLFSSFEDSRQRTPQHTFFYPIEVYDAEHIEQLAGLVRAGHGDIEVHLHHDNDCSSHLRDMLESVCRTLHERHGLLSRDGNGQIRYGFIHGNWALDNSHPEGRHCGVNDELSVLMETGCYADFTMPAAPHPAQTRQINSLYYAVDDPSSPKSHDTGRVAQLHTPTPERSLLMIQGPLTIEFARTKRLLKPQVENGNLSGSQPPSEHRIAAWLKARVCVYERPDWLFIKLHTHGAQESNANVLLGEPMCNMHRGLRRQSEKHGFQFYYVTAREMALLVRQAEQGMPTPDFDKLSWQSST